MTEDEVIAADLQRTQGDERDLSARRLRDAFFRVGRSDADADAAVKDLGWVKGADIEGELTIVCIFFGFRALTLKSARITRGICGRRGSAENGGVGTKKGTNPLAAAEAMENARFAPRFTRRTQPPFQSH